MPFISIIIPTHNNEEHIEQAILSCFDSDFDDLEVIVVNDASTDRTEEKIKKWTENAYPKITEAIWDIEFEEQKLIEYLKTFKI